MNKIAFEDMNKKKRALYECMWGSGEFDFPVEKTWFRGSASNNSYTFTNASAVSEIRDRLAASLSIAEPAPSPHKPQSAGRNAPARLILLESHDEKSENSRKFKLEKFQSRHIILSLAAKI